ncbi:hypothetical protein CERSUDRAFT_138448 [Gelatoporia subvermispora B]|uniref:SigF-like NTF2-like domain-containing protein n=1 Tax=Ceriporiopsis subvermispora (strain B) TaxID=914234 RepID=M2PI08_CERS8|nr:hypothetical protein CERSUDRAFT_138448 [Gelatoporia subvermispora B]
MENPAKDISTVIQHLTSNTSPSLQTATVKRYFTPDASFRHALCAVPRSARSRDLILGVYKWYRFLSPHTRVDVQDIVYNDTHDPPELFVRVLQVFHPRWSLLPPGHIPVLVQLTLKPEQSDGGQTKYLISSQEDFFHPVDLIAFAFPPGQWLAHFVIRLLSIACIIFVKVLGVLGIWSTGPGEGGRGVKLHPEGEKRATRPDERSKRGLQESKRDDDENHRVSGDDGHDADTEDEVHAESQASTGAKTREEGIKPLYKTVALDAIEDRPVVESVKGVVEFREKAH